MTRSLEREGEEREMAKRGKGKGMEEGGRDGRAKGMLMMARLDQFPAKHFQSLSPALPVSHVLSLTRV